jgi:hypothetical protein
VFIVEYYFESKSFAAVREALSNVTRKKTGSSVSIVSGYGLNDQEIEGRSPAEARDFSSNLCVQAGSGAHPASCLMRTGGPFHADHSPPSSAEVENE